MLDGRLAPVSLCLNSSVCGFDDVLCQKCLTQIQVWHCRVLYYDLFNFLPVL